MSTKLLVLHHLSVKKFGPSQTSTSHCDRTSLRKRSSPSKMRDCSMSFAREPSAEVQSQELVKLNQQLEQRVADQVGEIERMGRLRRFLPPQVADLIVASGTEKQLESHRREITALFCDLRGFTGFTESADPEDVMALACATTMRPSAKSSSSTAARLNGMLVTA